MEFKTNDLVVVNVDNPHNLPLEKGDEGVVMGSMETGEIAVSFEEEIYDAHSCDGLVPSGNGFFIEAKYLTIIE